jgi:glyoxylase-like metal-dependent hydrolase (beta-lactamase superfamily II)
MIRIVRVLAPNPSVYTLEGTNTWVVGQDPAVVIDPGPDDDGHLDEVARTAGRVGAVLVTHDHEDHAPGAAAFGARSGAPVYAFRLKDAEHIRDEQVISAGAVSLVALHTPGHSSDHFVFHLPAEGGLFTGDAVLGRGTSFIDPPDGDLAQFMRSLKRMQELAPRALYPGHGPVVLNAAAKLQEYVGHRAEREQQIIDAMTSGAGTIAAIVGVVYADYPADVHALAGRSVLAHLLKLESEGRAKRSRKTDDAQWELSVPRACARCGRPVKGRAHYCASCSLVMLQEGSEPRSEPASESSVVEPEST